MSVYFITAREIGRVKIGFSAEPRTRFIKMRTDSPVPLKLERVCDGDQSDERALHQRFASDRMSGEWFAISPAIEAHMATLLPPSKAEREQSLNKMLIDLGMTKGYASQLLSGAYPMPISIAISAYRHAGILIGPLLNATDDEIDVLEKYCGRWSPSARAAA